MSDKWLRHFLVTVITACAGTALMAAPQIQMEKESLDFGKISGGQPINVVFAFKNVGDADLEIINVKPGCGCTHAEAKAKKLAPGEASTIEAVFNSTGFSGRISKGITVTTNDPDHATMHLSIQGQVIPVAEIKPALVNFGSLKINSTGTHTVTVVPTDPKAFVISKVEAQGAHTSVQGFKKVETPAGTVWEITVVVKADEKPGRVMERINITTNSTTSPKLSATVYGNVVE